MKEIKKNEPIFLVLLTSILVSLLNASHVLIRAFKVPADHLYLWTGHYFADYFAYIQVMVQGARGNWLVKNPYATDEFAQTFLAWGPDLLLGKLTGLFSLDPFFAYWLIVAVFSFILTFLIFKAIQTLLPRASFRFQYLAFLITLLAAPFFEKKTDQITKLVPFDFWYAPSVLFQRFGKVPRHLLDQIIALVVIFIFIETLKKIKKISLREVFLRGLGVGLLLSFVLTFSYLSLLVLGAVFLTTVVLILKDYSLAKKNLYPYLLFLGVILVLVLPVGLLVKHSAGLSGPLTRAGLWDAAHQVSHPLWFILATIGPVVFLFPFGLKRFFGSITPSRMTFFFLFGLSWLFFFLPIAPFFQTANVRFLTPLMYLLFGVMAALGLKSLSQIRPKWRKKVFVVGTVLLFVLFLPGNWFHVQKRLIVDHYLTYLPLKVYEGFQFLNRQPDDQAMLTAPAGGLGTFLPIFTERKVYLGREFFTPDFEEKRKLTFDFYEGKMSQEEAREFINQTKTGYVILRSMEGFSLENLLKYSFLKPVFENENVVIFKVKI